MIRFLSVSISDFKVIESGDVDLDSQGLVLIRGINNDTDAASSNGSGKTTLAEAISWALYGRMVGDPRPGSTVVTRGMKRAIVSVQFERCGVSYVVRREQRGKVGTLSILEDGVPSGGKTKADAQEEIIQLLGLDWEAFRNTVLYGQGDVARFSDESATDKQRKQILKRIMNLERCDDALQKTRSRLKEARSEHMTAEMLSKTILDSIERSRDRKADTERLSAEHERGNASMAQELQASAEKEQVPGFAGIVPRIEKIERILEQLEDLISQRECLQDQKSALTGRINKKTTELSRRQTSVEVFEGKIEALSAQIEVMEAGTCPLCAQGVGHLSHARSLLNTMRSDLASLQSRREASVKYVIQTKALLEGLRNDEEELNASILEGAEWVRERRNMILMKMKAQEIRDQGLIIEFGRKNASDRIAHLESQKNPYDPVLSRIDADIESFEVKFREAVGRCDQLLEVIKKLEFWEEAYGNRGIPSLAMDSVMPIITRSANSYLQTLADGDITVDISTEKELKSGEQRDEITISVTVEGVENVRPSAGQRRKVSLAIDLSLMDLVASREQSKIDMLLLDEILDGLDAEGRSRVMKLLTELREKRGTILVISHDSEIEGSFEKTLVVRKNNQVSTVEVE